MRNGPLAEGQLAQGLISILQYYDEDDRPNLWIDKKLCTPINKNVRSKGRCAVLSHGVLGNGAISITCLFTTKCYRPILKHTVAILLHKTAEHSLSIHFEYDLWSGMSIKKEGYGYATARSMGLRTIYAHLVLCVHLFGVALLPTAVHAQSKSDPIVNGNFNEKYLEHLVKIKIDSVRTAHKCGILVNDTILYKAAKDHSNYMVEKDLLSHFENDREARKTPQLRAEFHGAINYSVGENVLYTYYNTLVEQKNGKKVNINSYGKLADQIVTGWVNSPGHFANMITPQFNVTGVSVALNRKKNKLYACQKFAQVHYRYQFEEPKDFFIYSDHVAPEPIVKFPDTKRELTMHDHEWGVDHIDLAINCANCDSISLEEPLIELRYEKESFILKIENSEYVKRLMSNKKDGFAVEIVEFEDYMCGNPAYYLKPGRRNGQCMLNGKLLMPVYRDQLYKGYKGRKANKDITYLSYILNNRSVPFLKRFSRYKLDKFSSKYFEINLGKLPKDIHGHWSHNLVYIQNGQICKINYFTSYCGDVFEAYDVPPKIPFDTLGIDYTFGLDTQILAFEIPFEKGRYTYSESDVAPFIRSISNLDFTVDSIHIVAYSSVEGDSALNAELQIKRAQSVVKIFQDHQTDSISASIRTQTDMQHFVKSVSRNPKWRHLALLDNKALQEELKKGYADSLEQLLSEERRASIRLFCTVGLTQRNLGHHIQTEYQKYADSLSVRTLSDVQKRFYLSRLGQIQQFAFKKIRSGHVDSLILATMQVPNFYELSPQVCENFFLLHVFFPYTLAQNSSFMAHRTTITAVATTNAPQFSSPVFNYNYSMVRTAELIRSDAVTIENVQAIINRMELLKDAYTSSPLYASHIYQLNFNINMVLLNKVFRTDPVEYTPQANRSIYELYLNYEKHGHMNEFMALSLAKQAVFFGANDLAVSMLSAYSDKESVLDYGVPLYYDHVSSINSTQFYSDLITLSSTMSESTWCNMFLNECKIPFQAFDHEELRNIFCQKCLETNDFLKEINP